MIKYNPQFKSDGTQNGALTSAPSDSIIFDVPGKCIWVKGVKLATSHTYTFSHDNYITLTNTPGEPEDILIGVNTTALKNAIDTTYGIVNASTNGLAPMFSSANKTTASAATTYNFLGIAGSTLKWYQLPWRNIRINSDSTDKLGVNDTDPLIISQGDGISVTWDSTNKKIVISNTAPDQDHNTDYTTINKGTAGSTTEVSQVKALSSAGVIFEGGTNKFKVGDGTNYFEIPITPSFTVDNKAATIGQSLTTIATINGTDITAKVSDDFMSRVLADGSVALDGNNFGNNVIIGTINGNTYTGNNSKGLDNRSVILHFAGGKYTGHWNQIYINSGSMAFRTEDHTNWYEIAHSGNIISSDATLTTSLLTIATIAGVEIKAKITNYNTDENVKQTPKTDNVNRPLMMINGGTSLGEQINTSLFSTGIYANASTKMITANGFVKTGSDSSHVLLGDGGHKALSDFSMAHSHPYLPLAGGTMDNGAQIVCKTNDINSSATYNGGIQLREYNLGTTSLAQNQYNAPGITFHWGGWWAGKLYLLNGNLYWNSNVLWHAGNDGSGSGLDADLLDGTHKADLLTAASLGASGNSTTISVTVGGTTKTGSVTVPYATNADKLDGYHEDVFFRYRGELYLNNGHNANTLAIGSWIFRSSGYGNVGSGAAHANALSENSTIEVFQNLQLSTSAWSNSVSYRVRWGGETNSSRPNAWSAWYTFLSNENYTNYVNPRAVSKSMWGGTYIDASGNFQSFAGNFNMSTGDLLNMTGTDWDGFAFNYYSGKSGGQSTRFYNGAYTEIVRFTAGGSVGIGTSSPSYKLHVSGSIYSTQAGQFGNVRVGGYNMNMTEPNANIEFLTGTGYLDWHYNGSTDDYTTRLIESASGSLTLYGNLGLSRDPSYKLDVNGNVRIGTGGSEAHIYVSTTNFTNAALSFYDDTSGYGTMAVLGGGGCTVVGAGESAHEFAPNVRDENLYLTADANVNIFTNLDGGYGSRRHVAQFTTGGDTYLYGNLYVGANDSNNFIAFYGNTGDAPGSYVTSFIGEHLWGSSESTELLLMKFNDVGNGTSGTTVYNAGPDRIRHLAHAHVFQIMTSTAQGSFTTMASSTDVETKLDIVRNRINAYVPIYGTHYYGSGFHHTSVDSDSYVLLAGGGYKLTSEIQAVPNKRWAATIQGSNWSRLYVGNQSTLHHSSIFSIEGSVGCVVFSGTYLVQSNHPTCAHITQLTGGNYTLPQMRVLVNSSGDVLVDMYWAGNDCSVGSSTNTMTVYVTAQSFIGSISPTTSLTNDTSIPSGYTNAMTITSENGTLISYRLRATENCYATHFYESSDMRLKHDISMLSKSIRKFRFNDDNKLYYGFIAQELETLHPELVDSSGEYKTVNYNSAICYYIAELENKVQKLEDEINKLKNK